MIEVTALRPGDRDRWTALWTDYLAFYGTVLPPAQFDLTWSRLSADREMHGLVAREGAAVLGICHIIFHPSAWTTGPVCYLQDLFTHPDARGRGVGSALIAAAAERARARSSPRLYWLTQTGNATARRLYDRVARDAGFMRYDIPL